LEFMTISPYGANVKLASLMPDVKRLVTRMNPAACYPAASKPLADNY